MEIFQAHVIVIQQASYDNAPSWIIFCESSVPDRLVSILPLRKKGKLCKVFIETKIKMLTKYWGTDLLLGIAGLVVLAYLYMTRKFKYWKNLGVMEPEPTPFIGNFGDCLKMKKSAGEWLQGLYNWGAGRPYIGFYVFDQPFFLARDPELIKNILVRDFDYFQDRFAQASPEDRLGNANLFFVKNPAWKYVRSKITPIYTSWRLKKMFQLMTEVADDLKTHMAALPWKGGSLAIELKELCAKYTTDVIATTAFGLKVNSLNNPDAEFRKCGRDIFNFTFYRSIEFTCVFFAPRLTKPLKLKAFSPANTKFLRSAVWNTLNERERSGINRDDLIDLLLELKKTQAPGPEKELFDFDGDNVVAQAAVFFSAGYETSGTTMSFTLYELALHQDVQSKLRTEIMENLEKTGGEITYDMISDLSYLHMVVSEILRKYPPLPLLDRVAAQDYKVTNSELVLKKGTPVYISLLGLHYDPQYFPDPHKFDPERFSAENKKTRPAGVYLPFGDGPHTCIGQRIGLLQTKLGLIELLRKFEFSPCEQTLMPMRFNPKALMLAADGGVIMNVRKISAN
ncbi:cytochrome P450 6k1 [Diachasma alloeum]|uniref:cytochrome P450 6k1 n=1 Tax=Diachasma alloeum TaxID=454923 RepID=UPI0010FB9CE6|nr:cytochrome P450 6k1 [Diachasma alloeum]